MVPQGKSSARTELHVWRGIQTRVDVETNMVQSETLFLHGGKH